MKNDIRPGARVAYSAKFLRSIGCQTGPLPFARGHVVTMRNYPGATLATVAWNDPSMPAGVNVANLISVDSIGLECVE